MASSNKHWPSMFKSKPCNNQQWSHHKSSILSNSCGHSSGCEERTPDPKPRWNPKPEQIRILEAIFNSGLINPPRDEIRRIRTQLQEYGNVGDANVFYWFQNRKSRSKHKQRALQAKTVTTTTTTTISASSSSSSSSDNHNTNNNYNNIIGGENINANSPNNSINNYFQQYIMPHNNHNYHDNNNNNNNNTIHEIIPQEPMFYPLQQNGLYLANINNSYYYDPMLNGGDSIHVVPPSYQTVDGFSSTTFHENILKIDDELSSLVTTPNNTISSPSRVISIPTPIISSNIDNILGIGEAGKSTVFINGMAIGIPNVPVNVKEEFGEGVILVHSSSGHAVVTDEFGVTLHPLQHGASYHLIDITAYDDLLASEFPYQI